MFGPYSADRTGMFALPQNDCRVCCGPHDDEIHAATSRVHEWFRKEMARRTGSPEDQPALPLPVEPDAA